MAFRPMVFVTKEEYDRLKLIEEKYDSLKKNGTSSQFHLDGSGEDPTKGDPQLQLQQILMEKKDSLSKHEMSYKPMTEESFTNNNSDNSNLPMATSTIESFGSDNDWYFIGQE